MSSANSRFSEDNNSIFFNSSPQTRIKVFVITNNIHGSTDFFFKKVLGIHQQKGIGSYRINIQIHIAPLTMLISCRRAEHTERGNAIFMLQGLAAQLQSVYKIFFTHSLHILFPLQNYELFPEKQKNKQKIGNAFAFPISF